MTFSSIQPWMVAAVGVVVTLLALFLQEKLTRKASSTLDYIKATGFNGLLSYGIAVWLLRVPAFPFKKTSGGGVSMIGGNVPPVIPTDVLVGNAPF